MENKIENILTFLVGSVISPMVSYELLKETGAATAIALMTGFFGGVAAMLGKMVVKWAVKKYFRK